MSQARKVRRARRWARYQNHYDGVPKVFIDGRGAGEAMISGGLPYMYVRERTIFRIGRRACDTFWGSHGCDRLRFHKGHHLCGTSPRDLCMTVDRKGYDRGGYQWTLFSMGYDA